MNKLNIVVIMQSPDIGGAEVYMINLINQFKSKGNKVVLASNEGKFKKFAENESIKTKTLPFILDIMGDYKGLIKTILLSPIAFFYYSKLLWELRKEKTNVILMSGFTEKLLVTFLSIFFRIPVVWIEYGPLKTVFKRNFYIPKIFYLFLSQFPEKIIVPTNNTYESLRRDALVRKSKLEVIPCGINSTISKKSSVDKTLKEKFVVGSISRLTSEKGQDVLIKAIPHVLKEIPNAYFIIAGDGPDKERYVQLIGNLGIEQNVRMPGFVLDVNEYYNFFDVFVFPTVWELEGFGLVAVEAMKNGVPVVGSRIGPVPEIVDDNINGILVNPSDESDLAKAIIKLGLDESLRKKLGENGRKKVKQEYDIDKISQKYLEIFNNAI